MIRKLFDKGFFHIFGSNVINRIINFSSSILLVRILTKSNYGVWASVENLFQIFLMLQGFGVTSGLLQFASENRSEIKKYEYVKTSLFIGLISNMSIALLIIVHFIWGKFSIPASRPYFIMLCLLPLFNIFFDIIMIFLRVKLKNKLFSKLNTLNSFFTLVFTVAGAYFFNITGVVIGRYLAVIFVIVYGLYYLKDFVKLTMKASFLKKNEISEFMKYSVTCLFANVFTAIYLLVDVFFIGYLLKDSNMVAVYKTATLIPFALMQIPASVVIFLLPHLAQNSSNFDIIKSMYNKTLKYMLYLNISIVSVLFILAPYMIKLMFGQAFMAGVTPFRLLLIGYLINGTIKAPTGNTLFAMKKVTTNLTVVVITGTLNIVLDYFLIKKYGMNGAAVTSVIVAFLSSVMLYGAIQYYFKRSNN